MSRYLLALLLAPAVAVAQPRQAPPVEIVPQPATTLPLKHVPQPTSAAITAADLMTRLYIFADDSMMGREAGTLGNVKGTDYIAAEAKRLGLVPAGDNGTFFQTIPFKTRVVGDASTLSIAGTALVLGRDWSTTAAAATTGQGRAIFAGTLGDTTAAVTDEMAAGNVVVYRTMPQGAGRPVRGVRLPLTASAVVLVGNDAAVAAPRRVGQFLDDPRPDGRRPTPPTMSLTTAAAERLFGKPLDQVAPGTRGATAAFDIELDVAPVAFPARNVVAILPGSDPTLKGQFVAIGAHNDHVGVGGAPVDHDSLRIFNHIVRPGGAENGGARANDAQQAEVNRLLADWRTAHPGTARLDSIRNGADDDGSGSVSVLEVAERMAALPTKPKRSILFVWHVGEEKGLLGASYFTEHPTVPRDSVVAQLNMDMVGRGNAWDVTGETKEGASIHGNPDYVQLVGSRRLSSELGDLIEQVNSDGKFGLTFDYALDANAHPMNIYCRSDHYEYARWNIPVTFFTTGGHSDYHQVTDEPQYIDYAHMARVASLVEAAAERVANLDHRPVVDGARMEPYGGCRQ